MIVKYILTIFFFILQIQTSIACDCFETKLVKESIKQADVVILAKVISQEILYYDTNQDSGLYITKPSPGNNNNSEVQSRYKVLVTEWFKGNLKSDTITIATPYDNTACGFDFKIGESYIIYGFSMVTIGEDWKTGDRKRKKFNNTFETNSCTRTGPVDKKEITEIKKAASR